jgi:hypothetical protein
VTLGSRSRVPWFGRVFLGAMLVTTVALLTSRAGFIPTWDGRIYAECIVDAGQQHLALSTLRCVEHISHAYMLFAGAIQMLSPGSFPLMLLANGILYLLACAAFYRLAELAFPTTEHATERALLTAAFAAQPAILASVVQPNIDLPMLPAFLWGTVFLIRRRWLGAIVMGMALIATKESGVLLYATLVFSYAIAMVLPRPSSPRSPIRALARLTPLAIPVLAFIAYIAYRAIVPHETVIWAAGTTEKSIIYQFLVPRIDRYFVNYCVMMLVLSFAWVTTIVAGSDFVVGALRKWRKEPARVLSGSKRRIVRFLIVLTVVTMYALTRFSSWGNSRYLLPVFALTPIVLYASLVRFGVSPTVRRSVVGALAALLLLSTVRTADPVSRALYGTWRFGDHTLLRMTRVTHECCGGGRDQLVYNLQYTFLGDLTSDATAALAGDSTAVFVPHRMLWETVGPLDADTHRRSLRRENIVRPHLYEPDTLAKLAAPPGDAIYVGLPNGDAEAGLRMLGEWYEVGAPHKVQRGGYWMNAYRLTLRDGR